MKNLIDLIDFVKINLDANKYNYLLSNLDDNELQLLEGIVKYNISTDSEAAEKFFNKKSKDSKYKKIKENLILKLYDAILLVQPLTNKDKTRYHRVSMIVNIFMNANRRDLAIPIIENNFNIAHKHFRHTEVLQMASILRTYYGLSSINRVKYEYCTKIFENTLEDHYWELKSTLYFENINTKFNNTKRVNFESTTDEIHEYLNELKPYINRIRSERFHFNYYHLKMILFHINNDLRAVIEECNIFLEYLKTLPFESENSKKSALRHKAEHYLLLNENDEALNTIKELLKLEVEGTLNWLATNNYLVLTYINLQQYELANKIVESVINHSSYKRMKAIKKRYFSLYQVYLHFVQILLGNIEAKNQNNNIIKAYLKEFPEFTKDKTAMNIPIKIIQLIEAIIQKNDSMVFDRLEALQKYSSRYITRNKSTRSNCFINMLIQVVKQNFHPAAIERHTLRYQKLLKTSPKVSSDEVAEVEIIPYEHLWELIMKFLQNRKKF